MSEGRESPASELLNCLQSAVNVLHYR